MAQVIKAAATGALTSLSGGRQPAGMRNVATVESAPIEGLSPPSGVSYEGNNFLFQEYGQGGRFQDRDRGLYGIP